MLQMLMTRLSLVAAVALFLSTAPASAAINASVACRSIIAQKGSGLSKTAFQILDVCHGNRDKGKFAGDCNNLTAADLKGAFARASAKSAVAIDKKCRPNDPVRNNYKDGHHIAAGLAAAVRVEVEANGATLEDGPPLVNNKVRAKCRKAIGKARSAMAKEVLKLGAQCQKIADKTAVVFGALRANCIAQPVKTGPKALLALSKVCGAIVDLSCNPFPACVVSAATDSGLVLLAAIYGDPAVCGDGAIEGLETCDDAGLIDGDGCDSNCTPTGCGNGITTAGEQCDDGNRISGDGCTSECHVEFCGDGIIQPALGEECDDGNHANGDGCEANCLRTVPATPTPHATPTHSHESLTALLGYVEFQFTQHRYHLESVGVGLDGIPFALGTGPYGQYVKAYYGSDWILGPLPFNFVLLDPVGRLGYNTCEVYAFDFTSPSTPSSLAGIYQEMDRLPSDGRCDASTLRYNLAIVGYFSLN